MDIFYFQVPQACQNVSECFIWEFDSTLRGWHSPGETCILYKKECPESNLRSDGDTTGIQTYKCDLQGKKRQSFIQYEVIFKA